MRFRRSCRLTDLLTGLAVAIAMTTFLARAASAEPSVTFSYTPRHPHVGQTVSFTGHVSDLGSLDAVTDYHWCYGYGYDRCVNPAQGSVAHAFAEAGDYQIEFAAYLSDGTVRAYTATVVVIPQRHRVGRPHVHYKRCPDEESSG